MIPDKGMGYLGNPLLKRAGVPLSFTQEQVEEYIKCSKDPIYFIENYVKIVNVDAGLIPFNLYKFQKRIIETVHRNRFTIAKLPRQSGKTSVIVAYFLHYILFNEDVNVAILANKGSLARDILGRLQLAYENLPPFLQQGIRVWNRGDMQLENGSKIVAASTSSSAIRGGSYNMILLDEFAFVPTNIADEFFSSVYPTISSGQTTKIVIVSTPCGMNHFYKLWTDAVDGKNLYQPIEVHWKEVPGRDEKWKLQTIQNTSKEQFAQEFESVQSSTLIYIDRGKGPEAISIGELYHELDQAQQESSIIPNSSDYLIETPTGFEPFYGINKIERDWYIHLVLTGDVQLRCSPRHPLVSSEGQIVHAMNLKVGDKIIGKYGYVEVLYVEPVDGHIELYDIVDSGTHHLYYTNEVVSHNCDFIGSVNTLISSSKLKALPYRTPIEVRGNLEIYEKPIEDHIYTITVDVSHGEGLDYSAFSIFDSSVFPYKHVAKYRNANIPPMAFPTVIQNAAETYNDAHVLVETNDVGQQVADILYHDLEYEYVMMITMRGRAGQVLGGGFGVGQSQTGLKMSKKVKQIGCLNLKNLLEDDRLLLVDFDTIAELTTFVAKGNSYEAESGRNDDLVMTLVLFAWCTTQPYFKDLTNIDARKKILDDKMKTHEEELAPFGFRSVATAPSEDDVAVDRGDGSWLWKDEDFDPISY